MHVGGFRSSGAFSTIAAPREHREAGARRLKMASSMAEVPVLIVGGGPVGLTASLLLSRQGIRSLLVERHPGTAVLPKARGINARTMEMYRQIGIEQAVRDAGLPNERTGFTIWTESLAGREIERRVPGQRGIANRGISPVLNCLCAQDDLEPVLRRFAEAEELAELRFSTEMTAVDQDEEGVTATFTDRVNGGTSSVRAQYLIAADGAQSRVRPLVAREMIGRERVYDSVNILFNADLRRWVEDRPANLYFVEQPDLRATFLTINANDRWGYLIHSLKQYGWTAADFTPERCIEVIRRGAGVLDLPVNILGVSGWEASAIVADRYRYRRFFLAGDAAHEMPPTGGFGLNTGVQDAQNLCWKLAAVLKGEAGDALLDTYDAERRPTGTTITMNALENALSMGRDIRGDDAAAKLPRAAFLNELGLIFGASYESAAVIADGTSPPLIDDPVTEYVPVARPGHRAPHVWLQRNGERVSTIDLFGRGFVLLTGPDGRPWLEALDELAASPWPEVAFHTVGAGDLSDPDDGFLDAYAIGHNGAVLIRPDGYVGWRCPSLAPDPGTTLRAIFGSLLGITH
jgi:2-polyprenyl-6-methoxyphenol hydroxylase-like FAD-dependent oxidoreductase